METRPSPTGTEAYPIRVAWSAPDGEFVATTAAFPYLSVLEPTADEALRGFQALLGDVLADFAERGEAPPPPEAPERFAPERFSGKFLVRLPKSLHATLAEEAAREGVSLNTLVLTRLATR